MFNNSLDNKPFLQKSDGQIIRDLTVSIFDFNANNYVTFFAYKIPGEYVMRPDLISQAVYNNTSYAEFILKYNGISNPVSVNQDEVILIPGLDSAQQNVKTQGQLSNDATAQKIRDSYKYIDPTKNPVRDPNLESFDRRNLDTIAEGALPPNISEPGTSQITYRNGRVYFGENIAQSACLKNGMSSSEFLTKIIQQKNQV